jgi:hypothetical protein
MSEFVIEATEQSSDKVGEQLAINLDHQSRVTETDVLPHRPSGCQLAAVLE